MTNAWSDRYPPPPQKNLQSDVTCSGRGNPSPYMFFNKSHVFFSLGWFFWCFYYLNIAGQKNIGICYFYLLFLNYYHEWAYSHLFIVPLISSYFSFALFLDTSSQCSRMDHCFDFSAHAFCCPPSAMTFFPSKFLFSACSFLLAAHSCLLMKRRLNHSRIYLRPIKRVLHLRHDLMGSKARLTIAPCCRLAGSSIPVGCPACCREQGAAPPLPPAGCFLLLWWAFAGSSWFAWCRSYLPGGGY